MIIFSDLLKRTLTALGLLSFFGLWMWASLQLPTIFYGVLSGISAICLYEWWVMARNHTGFLKYYGAGLIVLGFLCFGFLYSCQQVVVLLIVGMATLSDTLAYVGGRLIGGPKLCPQISPSKTWAGCLTSFFLTTIFFMSLIITVGNKTSWDIFKQEGSVYVLLLVLGFVSLFSILAQLGDLLESAAKRTFNVKDSGTWLPGHGGLLDRLDSILALSMGAVFVMGFVYAVKFFVLLWVPAFVIGLLTGASYLVMLLAAVSYMIYRSIRALYRTIF